MYKRLSFHKVSCAIDVQNASVAGGCCDWQMRHGQVTLVLCETGPERSLLKQTSQRALSAGIWLAISEVGIGGQRKVDSRLAAMLLVTDESVVKEYVVPLLKDFGRDSAYCTIIVERTRRRFDSLALGRKRDNVSVPFLAVGPWGELGLRGAVLSFVWNNVITTWFGQPTFCDSTRIFQSASSPTSQHDNHTALSEHPLKLHYCRIRLPNPPYNQTTSVNTRALPDRSFRLRRRAPRAAAPQSSTHSCYIPCSYTSDGAPRPRHSHASLSFNPTYDTVITLPPHPTRIRCDCCSRRESQPTSFAPPSIRPCVVISQELRKRHEESQHRTRPPFSSSTIDNAFWDTCSLTLDKTPLPPSPLRRHWH